MEMRICILAMALFAIVRSGYTQEQFAIGTDSPNPEAIMEIQSTAKGILIPRMTTAQRNTDLGSLIAADRGMLIYNTTDNEFNYWDGTQWVAFPSVDSDPDWYIGLGTTPPTAITDDIWTNGNVGIGMNSPSSRLDVVEANAATIAKFSLTGATATTGALSNSITSSNNVGLVALSNALVANGTGSKTGIDNDVTYTSANGPAGDRIGLDNSVFGGSGVLKGINNHVESDVSSLDEVYGIYSEISGQSKLKFVGIYSLLTQNNQPPVGTPNDNPIIPRSQKNE